MNRTDFEKLKDDVIGEAVLSILKEKGPMNFLSLTNKLRSMAATEIVHKRYDALISAINEIHIKATGNTFKTHVLFDKNSDGSIKSLLKEEIYRYTGNNNNR